MPQAVRVRSGWFSRSAPPPAPKAPVPRAAPKPTVSTAAAAELAARAAAGVLGVRAVTRMVRDHPLLTLLFACGVGYVAGNGWGERGTAKPGRAR
jgi:hypothetical protein